MGSRALVFLSKIQTPATLALSSVSQRTEIQTEGSILHCRPSLLITNTFTCFKISCTFLQTYDSNLISFQAIARDAVTLPILQPLNFYIK